MQVPVGLLPAHVRGGCAAIARGPPGHFTALGRCVRAFQVDYASTEGVR